MRREINLNKIVVDVIDTFVNLLDRTCVCCELGFGMEKFNLPPEPKDEYVTVFALPDNSGVIEIRIDKERLGLILKEKNENKGVGIGMALNHILDVMGNVDRSSLESNLETFVNYVCGRIKEIKEKCEKEKLSNVIDSLINALREMNESRKENKRIIPKVHLNILNESISELNKFNAAKLGRFCYANMKNVIKDVSENESNVDVTFATALGSFIRLILDLKKIHSDKIRIYGSSNDKLKPQQVASYELKNDRLNIYIKKRLVGRLYNGKQTMERLRTYGRSLNTYVEEYYTLISTMEI